MSPVRSAYGFFIGWLAFNALVDCEDEMAFVEGEAACKRSFIW